ncbi:MAG: excinuclease ABC subunit UvrC, partial [Candidatus Sumerlaeota bacterium]|nr:excinuclease ABC subunit UvrC [Candidatus Sumerlaeota bacterium]
FSVQFLRRQISNIECVVTANQKEAFLLENTLIKEHHPRYNVRLRDDKTYVSLRFRRSHDFPRLETARIRHNTRSRRDPHDLYFGPYLSSYAVRQTLRFLLRVFPVRTCKDSVFRNRGRPCILYDVGKCCGPCAMPVSKEEYARLVSNVALFLRGKNEEVRQLLDERMKRFSENMEFERAALVRDHIAALDEILEKQRVVTYSQGDRDVIAVASEQGRSAIVLQQYRDGFLVHSHNHFLKNYEQSDEDVLYSFIQQYYESLQPPGEILVDMEPADISLLEEWLCERRGASVTLHAPHRGELARLTGTARANAKHILSMRLSGERTEEDILREIANKLQLDGLPITIECADISNIMGTLAVGSIVRFGNAKPDKQNYRHYRIRTVEEANDFAMMREVLTRRFRPAANKPTPPPDLLILDGGKGQLGVAVDVLRELGITMVSLAAMAKSRRVKPDDSQAKTDNANEQIEAVRSEERLFLPGRKNPVTFHPNSPALFLLQRIRDEAHRFAITYHKKLRQKSGRHSLLDEVPGVGPKRKRLLLRHFGSLTALRVASAESIAAVKGVGESAARAVYEFLQSGGG